ncbi:esterase/lipase family protein [Actinomycetospora chibensis]|uniref:Esterase/lipase family protein n=1 Tax=Actinomycetospora chibensis TaxID=663606 RepID=A0ABV9RP14_9PSEU|nr:alpha/beta hydrolase [Actinomycetospora chibensis]MDD7922216.1 alpha/beta hydrolase [Actinomycetospora chibensis]
MSALLDDEGPTPWRPGLDAGFRAPGSHERPPSWPLFATDLGRALGASGVTALGRSVLRAAPLGDGHPVLVLPGLGAGDASTRVLRRVLRHRGYRAHGWHLGRNLGPTAEVVEGVPARLAELHERYARRVSIVGWSLGGLYARDAARRAPGWVRSVITLGSPVRLTHPAQTRAMGLYRAVSSRHVAPAAMPPPEVDRPALPVPCTSVFSPWDGIVSWRACVEPPGEQAESIGVLGSHFGLGMHPAVLWAVADRLAQPEGRWRPFAPPGALRWLYSEGGADAPGPVEETRPDRAS